MEDKEYIDFLLDEAETEEEENSALITGRVRGWVLMANGKFKLYDMLKETGINIAESV